MTQNTHSKFENSLKILKTCSNFWCPGVITKHRAVERSDLEFGPNTTENLKTDDTKRDVC